MSNRIMTTKEVVGLALQRRKLSEIKKDKMPGPMRFDERALILAWETVMREKPYALYSATEDNRLDVYGAKALLQALGAMGYGILNSRIGQPHGGSR